MARFWRAFLRASSKIFVWDVRQRKIRPALEGHTTHRAALAFLLDGKHLVTGGDDKIIRIQNLNTGKVSGSFKVHKNSVTALVPTPDGKQIVSVAGLDMGNKPKATFDLLVWNLENKEVKRLKGPAAEVTDLRFSPDGQLLVSTGRDGVHWWDFKRGKELPHAPPYPGAISAFSPDGKFLLVASLPHNQVKAFEVETGKGVQSWGGAIANQVASLPNGRFLCACYPHGHGLASASLNLLDINEKEPVRPYVGHTMPIRYVRFDPAGERLFSQGQDSRLLEWNLKPREVRILMEYDTPLEGPLRFSSDNRRLLASVPSGSGAAFVVRVRDLADKRYLRQIVGKFGDVIDPGFFSGDEEITTIHQDGHLRRWSIDTGKASGESKLGLEKLSGVTSSADESKFAVWSSDPLAGLVYDVREGKILGRVPLQPGTVHLVVSNDGRWAFAGKTDPRKGHIDIFERTEGAYKHSRELLSLHQHPVKQLYPSPDGSRLVSVDDRSRVVIWNAKTWDKVVEWEHKPKVAHVAWAPDSRRLAIAKGDTLAIDILRLTP